MALGDQFLEVADPEDAVRQLLDEDGVPFWANEQPTSQWFKVKQQQEMDGGPSPVRNKRPFRAFQESLALDPTAIPDRSRSPWPCLSPPSHIMHRYGDVILVDQLYCRSIKRIIESGQTLHVPSLSFACCTRA